MKLSYRDKVIFICAIVVIILVAGFFLFIKPKFEEMNSAKLKLASKQSEQADVQAKIDTLPQLVEALKTSAGEIEELQENFLTQQDPYLNEQFVHEILDSSNVEVLSMNTTYTSGGALSEYIVTPSNINTYDLMMNADLYGELPQEYYDAYNKTAAASGSSVTIGVTDVTIGYRDTYTLSSILKFADTVADYGKTMRITTLSKPEAPDDAAASNENDGSLTFRLYSIFPLNVDKVMEESDTVEITAVTDSAE
jgi:hypothetical protein